MARTRQAAGNDTKTSTELTFQSNPAESSGESGLEKNEGKLVPQVRLQSVQFKYPTEILNKGNLNQVADSQANLVAFKGGVLISSLDERIDYVDFVPMSAIKKLRYVGALPGELLLN